jgi:ABC-type uncharacterized transport system permease subunit
VTQFQQIAAVLYLAAGVGALLGLLLPSARARRGAQVGLAMGALCQFVAFATLHRLDPPPRLTDLVPAMAAMAWLAVIFLLFLQARLRLESFVPPVAFLAFLATFALTLSTPVAGVVAESTGGLPHAHVLLASAGLAALGITGLSGLFFLLEHGRLKRRRAVKGRISLPSLEALDRVNRVTLVVGFSLLSLGVVTGSLWLESRAGRIWSGGLHETWTLIAWAIYLGLVMLRFLGHQGARQAAASAVAGFAFLVVAVMGSGLAS